ncbi:hypothetical protein G7K_2546-t1 [Saitoella complicata NRRL Y-17804]|uniref:Uncharacterized protein n=1 Tax=Saitoella complicata (strain BCRC 22490 / CBS 7301 / JCM 7358 / NBRC 10748 / NRRL Y-17804) TaxID=698492 RepID=A0A0E9NEZ3_SAICN|nr:hypothetical protein G7K_2546-t1 [Saitoella complicata NRRL Y-17804]
MWELELLLDDLLLPFTFSSSIYIFNQILILPSPFEHVRCFCRLHTLPSRRFGGALMKVTHSYLYIAHVRVRSLTVSLQNRRVCS